jgi:hypothetical protein
MVVTHFVSETIELCFGALQLGNCFQITVDDFATQLSDNTFAPLYQVLVEISSIQSSS